MIKTSISLCYAFRLLAVLSGYQQPPGEAAALQRIEYAPGSLFVIVSDGFTDQIGSDGESRRAYGNRRLMELLQASRGQSS